MLMGGAALLALWYTKGDVGHLIVMYSINVFLTFSLSMFAMLRFWMRARHERPEWRRRVVLFAAGFVLCATILCITSYEKFAEGGWITLVVTTLVISLCLIIRRHYDHAKAKMNELFAELGDLPTSTHAGETVPTPDPKKPTAGILVDSYGGVGIHTLLNVFRTFPGLYRNVVFISVGVVDSGEFKGEHAVAELEKRTNAMLEKYIELTHGLGVAATGRMAIGTEVVAEAEQLCLAVAREFPRVTFFAGKMVFQRDRWWQRAAAQRDAGCHPEAPAVDRTCDGDLAGARARVRVGFRADVDTGGASGRARLSASALRRRRCGRRRPRRPERPRRAGPIR